MYCTTWQTKPQAFGCGFAEERSGVVKPREYEVGWLQFKGEEKMPDTTSLTVEQLKTKL